MKTIATLITAAGLVWIGTSCAKTEEVAAPALVSASVSGIVEADLDTAVALNKVAGALIVVSVSGNDQVANGSGGNGITKTFTGVTDANGRYAIKVDIAKKSVTATVKIQEMVAEIKRLQGSTLKSTRTVFSSQSRTVTLTEGTSETEDFVLSNNN